MQQSSFTLRRYRRQRDFVDERRAPAAQGWGGREEATGARPDFGLTPNQDPAIFSIWCDRVCSILTTPSVTSSIFFGA
jgi:hypothetical protein